MKCKDKIEATLNIHKRNNVTKLIAFQGLVNFYGKFCHRLSEVASLIFSLGQIC